MTLYNHSAHYPVVQVEDPVSCMVNRAKGIRLLPFFQGARAVARRCAGILAKVLAAGGTAGAEVPQTLKVEVLGMSLEDPCQGKRHGWCKVSIANLSENLVDRISVSLTLKQGSGGTILTVEHTYAVRIDSGEFVEVNLDLGVVPCNESQAGVTTEVRVLASRHVNKRVPTYILPDSATGVCTIEEPFALSRDISLERIDISLSRNFLRNRGWARVMYVIGNDTGIAHKGLVLLTRFYSMRGELLGEEAETFTLGALGSSRVTTKVTLRQARGLGATRFEAEVDGFEDIGCGTGSFHETERAAGASTQRLETWEGEEVKGAYWINWPS
ncbi:MAG: hypothetical protein RIS36_1190 [Pseudomonadota bacterium]